MKKTDKIRRYLAKGKSVAEIAKLMRVKPNYIHTVKWLDKKNGVATPEQNPDPVVRAAEKRYARKVNKAFKSRDSRLIKSVLQMQREIHEVVKKAPDLVNNPPHYKVGGIDTLDFILAKDLNFLLGNAVKYISRAGRKVGSDPVQDLEKAVFYLNREIQTRKSA